MCDASILRYSFFFVTLKCTILYKTDRKVSQHTRICYIIAYNDFFSKHLRTSAHFSLETLVIHTLLAIFIMLLAGH